MNARAEQDVAVANPSGRFGGLLRAPFRKVAEICRARDADFHRQLTFQQLLREAGDLPPKAEANDALRPRIAQLIERGERSLLSWPDLFELEALILRGIADESIRQRVWRLREEFRRLATAELYESYNKSTPPAPSTDDIKKVRADAHYLLDEIQRLRVGRRSMDKIRAGFSVCVLAATMGLLGWLLRECVKWHHDEGLPVMVLVVAAGTFGGVFSLLTRLYQLPDKGDLLDRSQSISRSILWYCAPILSIVEGMIAAIVLYVIFHTPVVGSNPIFPNMQTAGGGDPKLYELFMNPPHLASLGEGAKIFLWCFVAGFSERLVPDMLQQLDSKARARGETGSSK